MLNPKTNLRELAYVVKIDSISSMNADRLECAHVLGWNIVVGKNEFKPGDKAVYFEIDSQLPAKKPFSDMEFLVSKHYKVKTQRIRKIASQGLLVSFDSFGWPQDKYEVGDFLTEELGVTYNVVEDNARKLSKPNPNAKYQSMINRHPWMYKNHLTRWMLKHKMGKKILFVFFGKAADNQRGFPTKFPFVKKTDQERCENMTWVLNDKTPFIVTQKCDGSSGTYILEKRKNLFGIKYEFYVCSRNVRQLTPKQKSFYDENYYWECAIKYDIKNKLKDYLEKHPYLDYVCWQGEVCSPKIQNNPQGLTETHLFCFHMIDSKIGKYDIRDAKKIWKEYNMETVPIINENYILPDNFEEFKLIADGMYDPSVCEGKKNQAREGFVYYKTTDPNFSFKNVSRKYLLNH